MTAEMLPNDRIHHDTSGPCRAGHDFRYHLAAGYLNPGDQVVDAACGVGYGADILQARGEVSYVGVDWDLGEISAAAGDEPHRRFVEADLRAWTPDTGFDVFVGFETIEHLSSYEHYIAVAKQARRLIVVSAPIVPTTHLNPWHSHNFAPGQIASLFLDDNWAYVQAVLQPAELSEIYVFGRRTL